jgi:hypothetical protein
LPSRSCRTRSGGNGARFPLQLADGRYDATGRTDEVAFGDGDGGWDAYFSDLFDGVDRKVLDEDKKKYQGGCTLWRG